MKMVKNRIEFKNDRILIFEPHPDDVAYNILGSVIKWLNEGKEIMICTITKGNNSTFKKEINKSEIERIMKEEHKEFRSLLGLKQTNIVQWNYDDLGLDPARDRLSLLEKMIRLIREFRPITVVTMDPKNIENEENPDHRLVAMTGFEAAAMAAYPNVFREQIEKEKGADQHFVSRILFYMTPVPNAFVDISGEILERKKEIGKVYKSQLELMTTEIDSRLRNLGLDPEVLDLDQDDVWEMVCESMAKERAEEANKFYRASPLIAPRVPYEYAEAFRLYFLGAVEKLRDYLPKELLTL